MDNVILLCYTVNNLGYRSLNVVNAVSELLGGDYTEPALETPKCKIFIQTREKLI